MKHFILFFIVIVIPFIGKSQTESLNTGIGYVVFGDGDHTGINYYSDFQIPLTSWLNVKAGLQIANAANADSLYIYDRHNVFNFANYYNLSITPVQTKLFSVSISGGGVWRYRSEITFQSSKTVYTASGEPLDMIENKYVISYDIGYNFDIKLLFNLTQHFDIGLLGQYLGYNKGSSLLSGNLCLNYKL